MIEEDRGNSYRPAHVILPSDNEEREARLKGKNFTQLKSSRPKVYSDKEIQRFNRICPEVQWSFIAWDAERKWHQLIESNSCMIRGEKK